MTASPDATPTRHHLSPLGIALGVGTALAGCAVTAALAWCGGFLWFMSIVPDRIGDLDTHTDAVVVLTGGSERLSTGIALMEGRMADKLFISGVHRGLDVDDILKMTHSQHAGLEQRIVLGHAAGDTVGNAEETAQWLSGEGMESLRLVTGAYHMPRSLEEFSYVLPNVRIIPHPVFPDSVKSHEWWRWPGTAALLASEYSKYLAALLRHRIFPPTPS